MAVGFVGTSWSYDFTIRGVRYREHIPEARKKEQALVAEAKARDDVFNGRYGQQPRGNILFSEFVEKVYHLWAENNHQAPYDSAYK